MELQKVVMKVPLKGAKADLEKVGAEFTKWIQDSSIPGVLIDVADYTHMRDGLGVILAAHEFILSLDQQDGWDGLRVAYRLNSEDSLSTRFNAAKDLLAKGSGLLKSAGLGIEGDFDSFWVGVADRLNATDSVHEDLLKASKEAFGAGVEKVAESAPKELPMIQVKVA